MSIGKNIKKMREGKGLTQREMAEQLKFKGLEISDKTISSWEADRTEPKMGVIETLASFFNCGKTDIIGGDLEPYYLNEETRRIAKEVFEHPELRIAFNATREVPPQDIGFVIEMARKLAKEK